MLRHCLPPGHKLGPRGGSGRGNTSPPPMSDVEFLLVFRSKSSAQKVRHLAQKVRSLIKGIMHSMVKYQHVASFHDVVNFAGIFLQLPVHDVKTKHHWRTARSCSNGGWPHLDPMNGADAASPEQTLLPLPSFHLRDDRITPSPSSQSWASTIWFMVESPWKDMVQLRRAS
jgi:hypothetical protein